MSNVLQFQKKETAQERMEAIWSEQEEVRQLKEYCRKREAALREELGWLLAYNEG